MCLARRTLVKKNGSGNGSQTPEATVWAKNTLSGPSRAPGGKSESGKRRPPRPTGEPGADEAAAGARLAAKALATEAMVGSMPHNATKAAEHGEDGARSPQAGQHVEPPDHPSTGSTLTEAVPSAKTGRGVPADGENPTNGPLDRVRVDGGGRPLTTNQGVLVADNQNSLKVGLRGPTVLEDFILREKITHFDHERIPERVVHARGSGAHGYFECHTPLTAHTRAAPFAEAGKRTPVFVRFSTVAGERGSADTVRDVRGFAVKFYTDEGNWDLVGNNMPVFFIQDAMKFPDLIHAVKPEPHFAMPQASSAHDTFWDFVSLMPESTHMLMWVMSDRAIPRSYRTMQGFGVHTFRLVNADGESTFCKFHWQPRAGTHSLVWDEAVKISGADPDFHRRDLWETIEAGVYPEYELGVQLFTQKEADAFSFDVLDPTKIVPEELVPVTPVGTLVLDRNPDNFFAETEQVAFCVAHVVPGIDFTNDPLLQGRIHSYLDTQLLRLGGPNFHEIPVNAPIAQVHNNQRDGFHRQAIHRGRVSYEPNSLGGGCPFQAGMRGFVPVPEPIEGEKLRGKPERFADHYTQATLFWKSQSPGEQAHIVAAFRFELTRVQSVEVRRRVVASLANVDERLAAGVAEGLGIEVPAPLPIVLDPAPAEVERSPALSLMARPGDGGIRARRVALLAADGVDAASLRAAHAALARAGAVPRFVGPRLGDVRAQSRDTIAVDVSLEAAPSVLFDAVVLPDGDAAADALAADGLACDFVKDQFRHGKPILAIGASGALLDALGVPPPRAEGRAAPGILRYSANDVDDAIDEFMQALATHRDLGRETEAGGGCSRSSR
jgi:catalase